MKQKKLRINMVSETEFTVQGHGVHSAYIEMARALKKRVDADIRVNTDRPVDITHIQTMGTYALPRLLWGSGKKVVSAHLVPDSFIGSLALARVWRGLATWYLKSFYNRADLLLAVSDETRDDLEKIGVTKPIKIFYNFVDASQYHTTTQDRRQARRKLKVAENDFVVVGSGQVQPRKRVDEFIELAHKLPNVKFIWVGGMPFGKVAADYEKMRKMIDNAPTNVMITGVIPLEQVRKYYQAADVFILPSQQETFGMVVVEAAATGLPVILRDIPDYDATFRDAAIVVDGSKFAEEIVHLRDDPKYYAAAVENSKVIAKRFGSERGAELLMEHYRSLLD